MTATELRSAIAAIPRFPLATLPTPLQEARRLREALGGPAKCPRIFIKHDDLTGLALGGNKARKLEFLIADALSAHCDTLITTGSTQSNHARMTAAAARVAGLDCHLALIAKSPSPPLEGNFLLDRIYGAQVHHVVAGDDVERQLPNDEETIRDLELKLLASGRRPYVIPLGGSNSLGTLGYTLATAELAEQLSSADLHISRLYYASGSRGTQAGLTLGAKLLQAEYRVYGITISSGELEKRERALRIANEAADLLGLPNAVSDDDLFADLDFIGEGYGVPTPECLDAIALLARTEGILLDPCYTGKAMAGLLAHVRSAHVRPDETIAFLHTGGIPALFTTEFARQMQPHFEHL